MNDLNDYPVVQPPGADSSTDYYELGQQLNDYYELGQQLNERFPEQDAEDFASKLADIAVFLVVIAVCLLLLSVFVGLIVATWRSML